MSSEPQTPISALPPATTPLAGNELVPIVQNGYTRSVPVLGLFSGGNITVFGRLATPNEWTQAQTFDVPPKFPSLTGYMKANTGAGVTANPKVPTTDLSGVLQAPQFTGAPIGGAAVTGSTVDSTPIGATTPAAAAFTTLSTTGTAVFGGAVTIASGTINGTPIGGTTPAAGTFTTVGATTGSFGSFSTTSAPVFASLNGILQGNGAGAVTALATTGTGNVVLANSPTLVAPNLGTPSAAVLTNATGLPASSLTGLGTGVLTSLGLAVTGAGGSVLQTSGTLNSPILVTPALGTPASGNLANTTGFPAANLAGTALPAGLTGSSLTSVGTVTAGTWQATPIANAYLGTMPTLTVKANITGGPAAPVDSSLSAIIDAAISSTRGSILYRGASGWAAAGPGTAGYVLTSNGSGADPSYQAAAGGGSSSASVQVRQTVMAGPQASGAPTFLPNTTSGTLTLPAQNITSSAPLVLTAAAGHGASGAINNVYQFTSNPSWTLAASATNFLFVNASTGATSVQTLAPIYQFGGAPSTANGQFTFDYEAMVGYLGNGTSAVATPLVCVGEAVTSASAVTSTVAYAYNGIYVGSQTTLAAASTYAVAPNIGVRDVQINHWLENVTAENSFAVGDRVYGSDANYTTGSSIYGNYLRSTGRNSASLYTGNSAIGGVTATGSAVGFTAANWKAGFIIRRGWGGA